MTNIQFLKNRFAKEFDKMYIKSCGNNVYEISNKYFDDGDVELENTITVKVLRTYNDFKKYNAYYAFVKYNRVLKNPNFVGKEITQNKNEYEKIVSDYYKMIDNLKGKK